MEYLLDMQDPERIFYGGIPKTLDEAYRKSTLAFGGKMPHACNLSKFPWPKKSRRFKDTSVLSPILEKRMTSQKELTNESANTFANSLNATLCNSASRVQLARQLQASPEFIDELLATPRVTRLFEENAMEGPPVLLRDLSTFADGEILDVSFDWVLMHRTCGEMWEGILEELRGDPDFEHVLRNPHPMLGHRILEFAAKDEASHGEILVDDINFARPLRRVFQAISNIVHAKGFTEQNFEEYKVWKGDHCLVREFERGTLTSTWQIADTEMDVLFNKYYKGWTRDELRGSFIKWTSETTRGGNYYCRERDMDLLLFGLQDPCDIDEPHHTNDCGRCRRRDFFLKRYGSASDFQGSELVERVLKEKYHGKNDGLVKNTDEEKTRIARLLQQTGYMDHIASLAVTFQNVFSEHYSGQVSIRKWFHKEGIWESFGR